MIISLTGFMGCGKSSVGRELSRLLCCPFMDLDSVIEDNAGRTIPEIFASDGESAFRQMEKDTLREAVAQPSSIVLALGGGTVTTNECAEMVHEKTLCIYLRASVDTLVNNLSYQAEGRPLLRGDLRKRIEELMALRSSTYEKTAHIVIDTDGKTIEEIASELSAAIK